MSRIDDNQNRRRRIRLFRDTYDGPGLLAMVTIATRERRPIFGDLRFGLACLEELKRVSDEHNAAVLAYCFMPDHVHLVIQLNGNSNLIDVVRLFKGRTDRRATDFGIHRGFWQKSFYDHLLRLDETPETYVRYVIENPVRAGLAHTVDDYVLVGSLEYTAESLADLIT